MYISMDGIKTMWFAVSAKRETRSAVARFKKHRAAFYSDLADAISDKEGVSMFLQIRLKRAIEQKDSLAKVYPVLLRRAGQKGGAYSYMLQGFVPESDLMVISSIESQGRVDEGLRFLATVVKSQQQMKESLVGATIMPIVITVFCTIFIGIMSFFVIPVFTEIVPPDKWDSVGRSIYLISYITTRYGVVILFAMTGLGWLFTWAIPNWIGPNRVVADQYVPFRVIRDYQASIFLTSLASLLGAGETTVRSLEKLKRRGTPWLGWHISKITHRLLSQSSKNANYGEAFATGIFDRDLTNRLIDLSRRSSNFGGVIQRLGIAGIEDAKKRVEKSAKILNIVLTVVLGGFIAYLLIATIVTAQSLSGKLKAEVTRSGTGMTHNMHHK